MAHYLRIDDPDDFKWINKVIDSLMSRNPNDTFLINNYGHLAAWRKYLDDAVATKSTAIPATLVAEQDQETLAPPAPRKTRAKAAPVKAKRRKSPAAVADIFLCKNHPNRTGKQIPRDDCQVCWEIYAKFHPQQLAAARRKFEAKQRKKD